VVLFVVCDAKVTRCFNEKIELHITLLTRLVDLDSRAPTLIYSGDFVEFGTIGVLYFCVCLAKVTRYFVEKIAIDHFSKHDYRFNLLDSTDIPAIYGRFRFFCPFCSSLWSIGGKTEGLIV